MAIVREIRLDRHAYERYCQRVESVGWQELEKAIQGQLSKGYSRNKGGYIKLGDVWWRGEVTRQYVRLFTCYGVSHFDLPGALKWAKRKNDRIKLVKSSHHI